MSQQTFILSQVAEVAQVPRNTLRDWLRKDHFGIERPSGWQRFHIIEATLIGIYAEILKKTKGDHELALRAAKSAIGAHSAWKPENGSFFAVMHAMRNDAGELKCWISASPAEAKEFIAEIIDDGPSDSVMMWIDLRVSFTEVFSRVANMLKENGDEDE